MFCRFCGHAMGEHASQCTGCGALNAGGSVTQSISSNQGRMSFSSYAEVPWYRRNWFALICFLVFSPGLLILFITGNFYWESKGRLKTYSKGARIFLIVYSLFSTLGAISFVVSTYSGYMARVEQTATRRAAAQEQAQEVAERQQQQQADDAAALRAQLAAAQQAATSAKEQMVAAQQAAAKAQEQIQTKNEAVQQSTASPLSTGDLLARANACNDAPACVDVMLNAADPRRPDVWIAAAQRLRSVPAQGDKRVSRALNDQGLTKFRENDFDGAAELFLQAAKANPADVEARANLGFALAKVGHAQQAIQVLTGTLALDPQRTSTWVPLAQAYALDGANVQKAYLALLLGYEFSGNKQKSLDFFQTHSQPNQDDPLVMQQAYAHAVRTIQAGY